MEKHFSGKVWVVGDDIDTDIILPTDYLALSTLDEMAPYAFSPLYPELAARIQAGDILVAGNNFGCGSSREQAAEVLKKLGLAAIVAKSFARIFFRNAINNGLMLLENSELPDQIVTGEEIEVFFGEKIIHKGNHYSLQQAADNILEILECGGLMQAMKRRNEDKIS